MQTCIEKGHYNPFFMLSGMMPRLSTFSSFLFFGKEAKSGISKLICVLGKVKKNFAAPLIPRELTPVGLPIIVTRGELHNLQFDRGWQVNSYHRPMS